MNLAHVLARRFDPIEQHHDWRDAALYALGLGFGSDPLDEDELPYVYEGRAQRVVPSRCVTMGWAPLWQAEPETGIDWVRIVHGEQRFELHRPLPLEATIVALHSIRAVEDKGVGRGAVLHVDTRLVDAGSGAHLASLCSTQFLRGDGGCGSHGTPLAPLPPAPTAMQPTSHIDCPTTPQSALLYRLVSRDLMPIHADPVVARRAGFERPISQGLNVMGLACRAILKRHAPGHPERLRSLAVRFASPAYPGETIRVELFDKGERIGFRARALERDVIVLDRGDCRLTAE